MPINQSFLQEFEQESASTRKILQRVPEEHFDWKPHEKSFTLGRLATHIAELSGYISTALTTNELDFSIREYVPRQAATSSELMQIFEENFSKSKEELQKATDDVFMQKWKLRNGDHIIFDLPKSAVLRTFAINHLIHHRAQLSVYLRLLNVPVPGMYGPSADEPM
ncbi:MAG: DinB family protein [Bacteroidota bacterium]|nr:DinB family protein [Bacteroidota bacterium]